MTSLFDIIRNTQRNFLAPLQRFHDPILPQLPELPRMDDFIPESISRLIRHLDEEPAAQRDRMETLGKAGWYIDPHWPCTAGDKLSNAIKQGLGTEVDATLVANFEGRAKEIRDRLCSEFPARAKIIRAAIDAHIAGQYELSTPVLLIQSEGLWFDVTGDQLYGQGKAKKYIKCLKLHPLPKSLFHAATEKLPIAEGTKSPTVSGDMLNRHAILHGESTDYATKINSCKAISLVCYISWLLDALTRRADDDISADEPAGDSE